MQATVRSCDPDDGSAEVVLDDGTTVALGPGALDPRLRRLRPGQRVQLLGPPAAPTAALPGWGAPTPAGTPSPAPSDREVP